MAAKTAPKSRTLEGWKGKALHRVKLPSGMIVTVKLPNLVEMASGSNLPNSLRSLAKDGSDVKFADLSEQEFADMMAYARYVVAQTVVDPEITPDDVLEIPQEDGDALFAIAQRQAKPSDYPLDEE